MGDNQGTGNFQLQRFTTSKNIANVLEGATFLESRYTFLLLLLCPRSMQFPGSRQKGATSPVTGPPLWRSPDVSDPQAPVAEIRGGSLVAKWAWAEAVAPLQYKYKYKYNSYFYCAPYSLTDGALQNSANTCFTAVGRLK